MMGCRGNAVRNRMMVHQKIDHDAPTEDLPSTGPEFEAGTSLIGGRFEIVGRLGAGGMGAVYKGRDHKLGKYVALKFRLARQDETEKEAANSRQRFRDEAGRAQEITHPHVCRIFDVHEAGGYEVISMEFIDGEDLAELLRRIDRLTPTRAVALAVEICDGLAAIHQTGLFHQDLKPHNVMIDREGRAKISDLGLAGNRFLGGTPQYTAPEQLIDQRVSVQSDLFAFGLVFYEMLTGLRAYPRSCLVDPDPIPPQELLPELEPQIERVILHCLLKDPGKRPKSALQVKETLQATLTEVERASAAQKWRKWRSRRFVSTLLALAAFLIAVVVGLSVVFRRAPKIQPTPEGSLLPPSLLIPAQPVSNTQRHWRDGSRLVYVPGGSYELGDDQLDPDSPRHTVALGPFWIGKVPVTNKQFEGYLEDNAEAQRPGKWKDVSFNNRWQPVVSLDWEEARAYCHWAGMELPSEAQWEAAARGTGLEKRYPYPWGTAEPSAFLAHFGFEPGSESTADQPEFVGSFPAGAGPYGTLDQAGNVWEWCLDAWDAEAYLNRVGQQDPVARADAEAPIDRVVRGGSWRSPASQLHVAFRAKQNAKRQSVEVGFRCVLQAEAP